VLVKDIYNWASHFSALQNNNKIFEYSASWHFDEAKSKYPPYTGFPGVYIYARGKSKNSFDNCDLEVLYIGMSEVDVCKRIWSHVGTIYDPETGHEWLPKFKKHQWASNDLLKGEIKEAVATGNITVYCIKPTNVALNNLPRALEASLISAYYIVNGKLPPLNLQF